MMRVLWLGLLLILTGCVTAFNMSGTDKLSENIVQVRYSHLKGKGITFAEAKEELTKRAAKATIENGYTHFRMVGPQEYKALGVTRSKLVMQEMTVARMYHADANQRLTYTAFFTNAIMSNSAGGGARSASAIVSESH